VKIIEWNLRSQFINITDFTVLSVTCKVSQDLAVFGVFKLALQFAAPL